tara:strand:- start:175 stop:669 length:495 start_codon:yes stop_codon:yes gene_type:complete
MKKKIHLSSKIFLINKKFQKNKFYHYIKLPNVVITIPTLKNKKFILVNQKRIPINKKNYEFPSGWVDAGEKPIESAKRELLEETGYKTKSNPRSLLSFYPEPGRLNTKMICFYCKNIYKISKPEKGIKIYYYSKQEIIKLIKEKKFNNASHIAAFYFYISKIDL